MFLSSIDDHFTVELKGRSVYATQVVYAYTDALGVAELFARLAANERPWTGVESWESLEGEFRLSAMCSPLGEVTFFLEIAGMQGAPEEWRVSASITTEFGQLCQLSAGARRLFGSA